MHTMTPPRGKKRGTIRLTRRGWIAVLAIGSAAAVTAVTVPLLLPDDETRPKTLTVPEGWRSAQVYAAVDKALKVRPGTTKQTVSKTDLKLPGDAGGNPEGYLFPATYPIGSQSTPASVLSYMVNTANKKFSGGHVTAGADRNAVNIYQTVTIASMVEAEADSEKDMGKVARVIYNRLDRGMPLQMDSTINYALKRSTLKTTHRDTKVSSPYNTYARMGLPPTPIGNPGEAAMRAATSPTPGDWLYFVTVKRGDTRFTAQYEEQQRNVAEFNRNAKRAAAH
ncbi:endolytic transglycosylase MltG [Streptomyces sp. NPDC017941]|uniref:endolytic transglycosylase MltG n=1 Tax=unclassified Streptomyces TaxID=2593676 RepID=UPI00378A38C6